MGIGGDNILFGCAASALAQRIVLQILQHKEELERLGVEIDQFGKNSIVINSFPNKSENMDGKKFIEDCLENIKNSNDEFKKPYDKIAWNLSKNYAHSRLIAMNSKEMAHLTDCLFFLQISITK